MTITNDVLLEKLSKLNSALLNGEPTDELRESINADVKLYNHQRMEDFVNVLVFKDAERNERNDAQTIMSTYLANQYYKGVRLNLDKETAQWAFAVVDLRCPMLQVESLGYAKKADRISARSDWYKMLAAFCDNIALFRIGGDRNIVRVNGKNAAFAESVDLLKWKQDNGFACADAVPSKRELMNQLEQVFNAILPVGFVDHFGLAMKPVKADLNFIIDDCAKTVVKKDFGGWQQARVASMEKTLCKALEKRYFHEAYSFQSHEDKHKAAKASETEKQIARENAGAPNTTTMPEAGPVTVTVTETAPETKKTTRKSTKKSA